MSFIIINIMKRLLIIFAITSLIFGCAHIVSKELRDKADMSIPPEMLLRDPDAYMGKIVILGGVIVHSTNTKEGTYIEVVQKPLDYKGRIKDTDISSGRFLILYEGYLDAAIYSKEKGITVAGEVLGKIVRPLGEIQYPYLLIKGKEIHLSEPGYGIQFGIGIFTTF